MIDKSESQNPLAGESNRDSYHHGDLRQAILNAACLHLQNENADSLSLRALAREIGVSQTAPYRHFDSKNALFAGIATWGFQILAGELKESLAGDQSSPLESLVTIGLRYLKFSEDHAEKYQLFFDSSLVEFDEYPDLQEASGQCFNLLLGVIREGKDAGLYQERGEEEIAAIIWAGMHGIASLLQGKRLQPGFLERPVGRAVNYLAEERREVLTLMLRAVIR